MAYIIDPNAPRPVPPVVSASSDGKLTALLDTGNAGVQLWAKFGAGSGVVAVQFLRADGSAVRSGDPARAVGGVAMAYDHEAPLGAVTNWSAVPLFEGGSTGSSSAVATLFVPAPTGTLDVWLKPVANPGLARRVTVVGPVADLTYEASENASAIFGSPFPSLSWDVWAAAKGELTFLVETAEDRAALQAVMTSGITLMQTAPDFDWPDMFVKFGTVTRSRLGSIRAAGQTLSAPFTEVERPATEDSPAVIPGRSWRTVLDQFATNQDVKGSFTDWESVLSIS